MTQPGRGRNKFVVPGCCMSGEEVLDMYKSVSVVDRHRQRNPEVERFSSVFDAEHVEMV